MKFGQAALRMIPVAASKSGGISAGLSFRSVSRKASKRSKLLSLISTVIETITTLSIVTSQENVVSYLS